MATLTGQLINSTYLDFLWAPNSNVGITSSTLVTVCSGNGTATALSISTTQVQIGNINISGNTISSTNTNGNITLTPNGSGSVVISNLSQSGNVLITGSTTTTVGQLRFQEPSATGSTYVGFKSPASIPSSIIWALPATDSTGNQALVSNGSATLSFLSLPGGATALSFNSGVGITDANSNAVLTFTTTASAVNSVTLANAASGNNPTLSTNAAGLTLSPHTGILTINGSSAAGAIRLYNSAGTFYAGLQAGSMTANAVWTLPLTDGTNGQALVTNGSKVLSFATPTVNATGIVNPNILHNGYMNIAQRGTSFTGATAITSASGNYLLDRWLFLTNGSAGAFTVSQSATVPSGVLNGNVLSSATYSMEVLCVTSNKQFAIMQPLETKDIQQLANNSATNYITLSATVRAASGGNTTFLDLYPYIMCWTGTADTLTNTVTTWNTGTTPPAMTSANWSSNLAFVGSQTDFALTGTWKTYTQTFNVADTLQPGATPNMALMFYCPNSNLTIGDALFITNVKLEIGSVATSLPPADVAIDTLRCKRYFDTSFIPGTMPAQNAGTGTGEITYIAGKTTTSVSNSQTIPFAVPMRIAPTITLYSPGASSAQAYDETVPGACTSTTAQNISLKGFRVQSTGNASSAIGNTVGIHYSATADL